MGKRENTLLLLFGPTITVVGIPLLLENVYRGFFIILAAVFLTVLGSFYQWVQPKNRSKLWLLFPGLFSVFGYVPLMALGKGKRIFNRLYISSELYKSLDTKDSFTLVAANITKYYLELTRNYNDKFSDEATLLAATAFLEAKDNIERDISIARVLDIANNAVLAKEEALVNFIIGLEIILFHIDAPEFDISEVTEACFEKKRDIEYYVQKVKREYAGEEDFSSATSNFMNSSQFKAFSQALGIKEPKNSVLIK